MTLFQILVIFITIGVCSSLDCNPGYSKFVCELIEIDFTWHQNEEIKHVLNKQQNNQVTQSPQVDLLKDVKFYSDLIDSLDLVHLIIFIPRFEEKWLKIKKSLLDKIHLIKLDSLSTLNHHFKSSENNEKIGCFIPEHHDLLFKTFKIFSHCTWILPSIKDDLDKNFMLADSNVFTFEESQEGVKLYEVYYKPYDVIVQPWGLWNSNHGLLYIKGHRSERRSDMTNVIIRAASKANAPATILVEDQDQQFQIKGYLGDLWDILQAELNFTTIVKPSIDGQWGLIINGTWNGMIGMLLRNEADVIVAPMTLSQKRASVARISPSVHETDIRIFFKAPTAKSTDWFLFINMFNLELWITLFVTFLVAGCLYYYTYSSRD